MFYHYCKADTSLKIIETKCLWLTNLTKSNDEDEVKRTFVNLWSKIKDELMNNNYDIPDVDSLIELIDRQIKTEVFMSIDGYETPYGVCFSDNRDLFQNWKEYGDEGKGLALGFSEQIFNAIKKQHPHPSSNFENAIGWEQTIYDYNDVIVQQMIKMIVEILKAPSNPFRWLDVRTTLKHYSAFIKNPTFKDERETRIVYYPSDAHTHNNAEVSTLIETPLKHCCLPWIKSSGICALEEIIVGKNCNCSVEEVQKLLKGNGIKNDINIIKSQCSYRASNNR